MGEGKERPLGSKAAKAGKAKKLDAASIASLKTSKLATMQSMDANSGSMAVSMAFQAQTMNHQTSLHSLMEQAKFYERMGDRATAVAIMERLRSTHHAMETARVQHKRDMDDRTKAPVSVSTKPPVSSVEVPGSELKICRC